MIKFIEKPNLPNGNVSSLICGTNDEDILNFFSQRNIDVFSVESNNYIDPAVSTHADMSAIHLGKNNILIDKNQTQLISMLEDTGMAVQLTRNEIKGDYPDDIKLNFALAGNKLIGNFKYSDEFPYDFIKEKEAVNVKQGYCKCSVLVVNENAIITDDESIYKKAVEKGLETLLVSKGDVSLPGHEYGFIGGASGKISKDEIVFFGNIENHRDYTAIRNFLEKHNYSFICTDKNELRDIGGIIPLTERE